MLGAGTSTAEWGFDYELLLGHLRALVDDEVDQAKGKRAKLAERADAALCELEQIAEDMR